MKKFLSVLLCVCLLCISPFSTVLAVDFDYDMGEYDNQEDAIYGLTADDLPLDFENLNIGTNLKGNVFESEISWTTFAVAQDDTKVMKANTRWSNFYISFDSSVFEDDENYEVSFDFKADSAYTSANSNFLEPVEVLLKNADDSFSQAVSFYKSTQYRATGEWQSDTLTFRAMNFSSYDIVVFKFKYCSNTDEKNGGYFMLDNFNIKQADTEIDKTPLDITESADTDDTLKVLALGNSFSSDAVHYLKTMLKANDKDLRVGNCWISGASLQRHLNTLYDGEEAHTFSYFTKDQDPQTFKEVNLWRVLATTDWDIISLQQASAYSGQENSYEPHLGNLIKLIKSVLPDVEIVFHQTWAYDNENTSMLSANGYKNQSDMYQKLTKAYIAAAKEYDARIIPVGVALQLARAAIPGDDFSRDYHHGNTKACLLFAYVWYEFLTGISPEQNNYVYDDSIVSGGTIAETVPSDDIITVLKNIAHDVVAVKNYDDARELELTLLPTNKAPASWQASSYWQTNGGAVSTTLETHLGGAAFYNNTGTANNQSIYSSNVELTENTNYRLFVSLKGVNADAVNSTVGLYVYNGGVCGEVSDDNYPSDESQQLFASNAPTVVAQESNDDWLRVYFDFSTTDLSKYDLRLKWGDISDFVISDIALYAKTTAEAVSHGNGSAVPLKNDVYIGETVAFSAKADDGEQFLGWYMSDELVSTDAVINVTLSAESNIPIAKFTSNDLMNLNAWEISGYDVDASIVRSDDVITISNIQWDYIYLPVNLKASTDYYFNFDFRSNIQLEWFIITPQSNGLGYDNDGNALDKNGNFFQNAPTNGVYKTGKYKTEFPNANVWYENNSFAFKTNSNDTFYYIIIKTGDTLIDGTEGGAIEFKDISITKPVSTAIILEDNVTGKKGNAAIRAANYAEGGVEKNGLRIYNEVSKQFILDKNIIEYGSIVVRKNYMEQLEINKTNLENKVPGISNIDFTELNLDMISVPGVGHGLTYRSEKTITGSEIKPVLLWKDGGTSNIFTSYITGIDKKYYGDEYLVRSYAIDSVGNIYYGDVAEASVFKVVNAIDHTETLETVSDVVKAAYNAFVNIDESVKASYEAWCLNNNTTTGNLFE